MSFGVHYIAFLVDSLLRDVLALCFGGQIPVKLYTMSREHVVAVKEAHLMWPAFFFLPALFALVLTKGVSFKSKQVKVLMLISLSQKKKKM